MPTTKADLYFGPRPEEKTRAKCTGAEIDFMPESEAKKNKELIFYIDNIISI